MDKMVTVQVTGVSYIGWIVTILSIIVYEDLAECCEIQDIFKWE